MTTGKVEVYAIRYGSLRTRRSASFLDYPQYGEPDDDLVMDYFYWVVRPADGSVLLVDTGFDARVGERRGREVVAPPVAALAGIGIQPTQVAQILVTHGHYDHIGNLRDYPDAAVTVQQREVDFWRGGGTDDAQCAALVEPAELDHLWSRLVAPGTRSLDGDAEVAPGVVVRLVGGHTPGQQIVIVETGARPVVLTSDAVHFYEEIERDRPYAVVADVDAMLRTYRLLRDLEADGALLVAGHDPLVRRRFAGRRGPAGTVAVRIAA
jgi:glyoxylase-like metal-dependent hydrolase (beta-lactamase superfamily II)